MNLKEIRREFVRLSGRHDLVVDYAAGNYADNGANFIINMGQKLLDTFPNRSFWMRHQVDISPGQNQISIPNVRSIKGVWLAGPDGRTMLQKTTMEKIKAVGVNSYLGNSPAWWAINVGRLSPLQQNLTEGPSAPYTDVFTYDADDLIFSDSPDAPGYSKTAIIIMPSPAVKSTLVVYGRFSHPDLVDDADRNYWTDVHPHGLILASLWALEVTMRNTEGASDWMNAIRIYFNEVEPDVVDEEVSGIVQIPG